MTSTALCEDCSARVLREELARCEFSDERGGRCSTLLCHACQARDESYCKAHALCLECDHELARCRCKPDDAPESVPSEWWAGGFAPNH